MTKKKDYSDIIKDNTLKIDQIDDINVGPFKWLHEIIQQKKDKIKIDNIDYIIIKILNRNKKISRWKEKYFFDVIVIGTFRKSFSPTEKVSILLSDFYLEMGILPNLIVLPKSIFIKNIQHYLNKIKNGVLIYERG